MRFHLLAYHKATGAASTDQDTPAVNPDPEITFRNNHYIFTEQYQLMFAALQGATITRGNLFVPSLNMWTLFNIWPLIASADLPSLPNVMPLLQDPIKLPMNEEIQINNTDGASENVDAFLVVAPMNWTRRIPMGVAQPQGAGGSGSPTSVIGWVRATASATGVIGAWVTGNSLTFQQNLKGGTYAVIGAQCQGDDAQAFRLVFPRVPPDAPRKLRPGWLAQEAIGNNPTFMDGRDPTFMGEWGRFHSFEPPTVDLYANSADVVAMELRLLLVYLGTDPALCTAPAGS